MKDVEHAIRVNHLSIAVRDIDAALRFFRTALPIDSETGKALSADGEFRWCQFYFGDMKFELIEAPHEQSFVHKFIEKRGEGMHHLSFEVEQLEPLLRRFEEEERRIVDRYARPDYGSMTASISPRSAYGVLMQFWQHAGDGGPARPHIVPFQLRSGQSIRLLFDHVSIAVRDIEDALAFFRRHFSISALSELNTGYDGTFIFCDFKLGHSKIEIIAPKPGTMGFVSRFLERRGEGLHHISIDVDRLPPLLAQLEADGIRIVDRFAPSEEWQTAFISPRSAHGVLIQFWQRPDIELF